MKRHVLLLAAFLLAGAVVNVAVAGFVWWNTGCSLYPVGRSTYQYPNRPPVDQVALERWARHAKGSWPPETASIERFDRHKLGIQYQYLLQQYPGGGMLGFGDTAMRDAWLQSGTWEVIVVECGWPLHCVGLDAWRETLQMELKPDSWWPVPRKGGLAVFEHDGWVLFARPIPRRPLWPGFVANTALYTAVLWLLIPGPFVLRRAIRKRRGLCPACGYDLKHAEHESCPECGARRSTMPPARS